MRVEDKKFKYYVKRMVDKHLIGAVSHHMMLDLFHSILTICCVLTL